MVIVFGLAGTQTKAAQTFNQIEFVIGTADDDLRGNSSATATIEAPNGTKLQEVTLKNQNQGGWGNNSSHTVNAVLNPARSLAEIGRIVITLQSHNGFAQSDDNWNVQSISVLLSGNGAQRTEWANRSGTPLARLTGHDPSYTLTPLTVGPPGTFNQIRFVIGTGDDDLRGNSSATATIQGPSGAKLAEVTLKTQQEGAWGNNSTHTVTGALQPPLKPAAIGHIVIAMASHNGLGQTDDNWNVQSVDVDLSNNGSGATPLMRFSAVPLARLTGSRPSFTLPEEAVGPAGTFNQIQFIIGTGGDDLRGDSSASATLLSPNGRTLQVLQLKTQNEGGWGNNTTHTVSVPLNPQRKAAEIGHIVITLASHNGLGQTDDNWNVQKVDVSLSNNGVNGHELVSGAGNPLQRLTKSLPSLVLDNVLSEANVLGPQPGTGRLKGWVDLHTHPLANLGFGGKLFYGGVDVGSLLPADPDCNHEARALCMQQALGHDGSTHGGPGLNLNPAGGGDLGLQNTCGDAIREALIHVVQGVNNAADESSDARGAPDFKEWPVWNDLTHQRMWVDWIRRSYNGGLRVMVALAVNNKTLADMVSGPGDGPTDDKASADLQLTELKAFVGRHADFMAIASSSADLERIVRANKLAVIPGIEIDNLGDFKGVAVTHAAISAEITRLFNEGVRYVFPIHLLDNPFGGTAVYQGNDLMNYSTFRENGHWWNLECVTSSNYKFSPFATGILGALLSDATHIKIGTVFNPPSYTNCPGGQGQANALGLTSQGQFAIMEMMRHGMLIDIDHMSDLSQTGAIAIATTNHYPLNSGHSGLRILGSGQFNERQMSTNHYQAIARLHGMAGIGSAGVDAHDWVKSYQEVIHVMGPGAVAGFGTDTDGLAMGMKPRPGSSVQYSDSFPKSSLGTAWWDYNHVGVAHYGMLPDFLQDARTAAGGPEVVDGNLMFGADYFLQTWKKCEAQRGSIH